MGSYRHSKTHHQIRALKERDGARCWICLQSEEDILQRGDILTRDHIVPKSRGGSDLLDNMKLACRRCNGLRGCRSVRHITPGSIPGKNNKGRYRAKKEFPYEAAKRSAMAKKARRAIREALPTPSYQLGDIARGVDVLSAIASKLQEQKFREAYYHEVGRIGD